MTRKISALKQAIDVTLAAVADGRERIARIAEATNDEVKRLEAESERLNTECLEAIETVENLEVVSKRARERLLVVNRDVRTYGESDMKQAYENAQTVQFELGQWRERETQLRGRRDDVARRLKTLRATAEQAEVLVAKFGQVSGYLSREIGDLTQSMEQAEMGSLLGLQLLQMQEEERRRIAERLHDGPMQALASVAMRMQVERDGNEAAENRVYVHRQLNEVIGDLRTVVFDLRPRLLDDLGLVPALKRFAEQWANKNGVKLSIRLIGLERSLNPTEKVTIFRGVQEALQNVTDHAGAQEVYITLTYADAALIVEITDDGAGMGESTWVDWVEQGKMGLSMCRQRLGLLGGTLKITTAEPRGTRVVIQLPTVRGNL